MKAKFRIDSEGKTDVGRVRSLNEDSLLLRPDVGLWVVADGMGGHDAGDYASQAVVQELDQLKPAASARALLSGMEARVISANAQVFTHAAEKGTTIGCTLATLMIYGDAYACVWSGDSRVYLVRHGKIEQIARDHTEAQGLIDNGTLTPEEAETWPRKNVITRAIGVFEQPELDIAQGRIQDGDVFVVCSDGLTEHVKDDEIRQAALKRPLDRVVDELVSTTLDRGAKDNVTVIAIACTEVTAVDETTQVYGAAP